jgi:hypothetical protein
MSVRNGVRCNECQIVRPVVVPIYTLSLCPACLGSKFNLYWVPPPCEFDASPGLEPAARAARVNITHTANLAYLRAPAGALATVFAAHRASAAAAHAHGADDKIAAIGLSASSAAIAEDEYKDGTDAKTLGDLVGVLRFIERH